MAKNIFKDLFPEPEKTGLSQAQIDELHRIGIPTIGPAKTPRVRISAAETIRIQQEAFERVRPERFRAQIRIPFTKGGRLPFGLKDPFTGGRALTVRKTDVITPLLASFGEALLEFIPGLLKTIPEAQEVIRTGRLPRITEETRLETPLKIGGSVADLLVEKGVAPDIAEILGGGIGLGIGILDAFFTRFLGRGFTRVVLKNVAVPDEILQIAWQKLGRATTKEQAIKTADELLLEISPNSSKAVRQGTVDAVLTRDITDARTVILEKGIPTKPPLPARVLRDFARTLEADVTELITKGLPREIEVPFARPVALLPGARPARGELKPRLGLQIEEIEPVGRAKIPKELEPLAIEARKFKTAEEFVDELVERRFVTKKTPAERTSLDDLVNKFIYRNETPKLVKINELQFNEKQILEELKLKPGRIVDVPVIIEKGVLKDGHHRVAQSIANRKDTVLAFEQKSAEQMKAQLTDFFKQAKGVARVPAIKAISETPAPLGVRSAKEIVSEAIPAPPKVVPEPTASSTIQKLTNALRAAKPLLKEQEALIAAERARRVGVVAAVGKRVPGERGFFAQLAQLKGKLPKAQFEALRKQFSQKEIDSLFDVVEQTRLLPFEKITAKGGLLKLFEGKVPTQGEIGLLRDVFPKGLIDEILRKRPVKNRIMEFIGQVLNVPRSIMASVDFSAPLRQGIFLIGRPKQFIPAFGTMFKVAFSEKAFVGLEESIKARPTFELMRKAKLAFTDLGTALTSREEAIMSNIPERFPLIGGIFRGSNRAFTGFLNKLRADVFDDIITNSKGIRKKLSNKELEDIGRFVNAATGRGDLGQLQRAAVTLNTIFFSPRLIASRLNLLNPIFYISLSPVARKEALKSLFSFAAISGTIMGLAQLGGAEVGVEPRSANVGKIKVENTRYDVLGGFQQYLKIIAQLTTGEIVSSTTGRTMTLGEGFKPLTRKDILLRFFENKESPIASFITGLMTGTTFTGEDFDVPTQVINRFIPMVMQDMFDLTQEKGAEGLMMAIPAIFGVGVQTYGKQELVFGEGRLGEPTAQISPVPELAEKIREIVLGQLPLGTSKNFSIEAYYDELSNLPTNEAADIFDKIEEANPELAKKLSDIVKERELGITVKDKDLKSKGVASGDRALAIKKELDKKKTDQEKAVLWDEFVRKGVITKEIARQLNILQGDVNQFDDAYDRNIFGLVSAYAKAFTIDPGNAFRALFTKEKLGIIQGNLVELERFYDIFYEDKGGSQEFKRNLMKEQGIPLEDIENWRLEHITPVKAGGSTADTNLILVTLELHNFFTPIDIAVGNAVKNRNITRQRAEELMKAFKIDKTMTAEEVISDLGG